MTLPRARHVAAAPAPSAWRRVLGAVTWPGGSRVLTVDDVRRATDLPVVGQLPGGLARASRRGTGHDPATRAAFRETVLAVKALSGGRLPGVLVLAGPHRASGTLGVAPGLAGAVVELGSPAALVHADRDDPSLARRGDDDVDLALPPVGGPDPAGFGHVPVPDVVAAGTRRLGGDGVRGFVADLREAYAVVVVPASPDSRPLPLRAVLSEADAVVVVARAGRTTQEELRALVAEACGHGAPCVGVVLTGVSARRRVLLHRTWTSEDVRSASPEVSTVPASVRPRRTVTSSPSSSSAAGPAALAAAVPVALTAPTATLSAPSAAGGGAVLTAPSFPTHLPVVPVVPVAPSAPWRNPS